MDPLKSSTSNPQELMRKAVEDKSTSLLRKALDGGANPSLDYIYSVFLKHKSCDQEYRQFVAGGGAKYCDKAFELVSSKNVLQLLFNQIRRDKLTDDDEAKKYEQILLNLL